METGVANAIHAMSGGVMSFTAIWHCAKTKYPVGAAIPVHYSPGNPQESVLQPGLSFAHFSGLVAAAVLLISAWNQLAAGLAM